MNPTWKAISREAGIAAEHICIGVTALGNADYARQALYGQAFFALSVGFERSAKLALVVDHAQQNAGAFPNPKDVRKFGHNLRDLLRQTDAISQRRGLPRPDAALPSTAIHNAIVDVLTSFASNETRYYDLDFLTGDPAAMNRESPIASWHRKVTLEVIKLHRTPGQQDRLERNAQGVADLWGTAGLVMHTAETGSDLRSFYDASLQANLTAFASPYTRLYVLQIARFLAEVMCDLGHAAYGMHPQVVPDLTEFFRVFINSDRDLRKRKKWTIYV